MEILFIYVVHAQSILWDNQFDQMALVTYWERTSCTESFKRLGRCHTRTKRRIADPDNASFGMTPNIQYNLWSMQIVTSIVRVIPREGLAGPHLLLTLKGYSQEHELGFLTEPFCLLIPFNNP